MKPLFERERKMLETELGIKIPFYCWRETNNTVFLNAISKQPLFKFVVSEDLEYLRLLPIKGRPKKTLSEHSRLQKQLNHRIINRTTIITQGLKRKSPEHGHMSYFIQLQHVIDWSEEYSIHEQIINEKVIDAKNNISLFLDKYPLAECEISVSGGKDSDMIYHITSPILNQKNREFKTTAMNSTNEIGKTYKHIKKSKYHNFSFIHPKTAFIPWLIKEKDLYLPTANSRTCCDHFKENLLKENRNLENEYIFFLGVRKNESSKREKYEYDVNEAVLEDARLNPLKYKGKEPLIVPYHWHRFAPIVHFLDHEVWLYLLHHKVPFNELYEYGFNRTGCAICPYASAYNDFLIKRYFKPIWERFMKVLEMNYIQKNIKNLYWTLSEWKNGKWKTSHSKIYEITKLKKTPERVAEVMTLKKINEEIATEYFDKKCNCGKKLNPDEVAMNLKLVGRFQYQTSLFEDSKQHRIWLCKKCLCREFGLTDSQYKNMIHQFRASGCSLF